VLQWAYNANSGDTGGLVDDTWWNLLWVKLRFLRSHMGLTPWYLRDSSSSVGSFWSTDAAVSKPKPKPKTNVTVKAVTVHPKPQAATVPAASKPKKTVSAAHKAGAVKKQT
jgi:hypothetical protein